MRTAALAGALASVLAGCSGPAATPGGSVPSSPAPRLPTPPATTAAPGTAPLRLVTGDSAYGAILETGAGYPVYVFSGDGRGTSRCTGSCAAQWPPVPSAGSVLPGPGVQADLVGRSRRPDGGDQVTYAGRPLYTNRADISPGQLNGQGASSFGGQWHLVDASGQPASAPVPSPARSVGGGA
ncbi:MAG TPA: hypothetical protein VFW71_00470 [Actinomycetota bacterium]|nr:hypothetical protein [Actinomycetota bacterium]